MSYPKEYLHAGSASDLVGKDRILYRALEMLPGLLAWGTIVGVILLSWKRPAWVAVFIIVFDLYWSIKTIYLSFHLRSSWQRMQEHLEVNWATRLEKMQWQHVWQLVIVPSAGESFDVIEDSLRSLSEAQWPKERMIVVLALEDKGLEMHASGEKMYSLFARTFGEFLITYHPAGTVGEMRGKGSNETYAAREAQKLLDQKQIAYKDVLVSSFDEDTRLFPHYFTCLTWHFLTTEKPYRSSFQPVPLYHNNLWDAGQLSRVVATSGTFWQMMQQERPERLTTFSSHSMTFESLVDVGFWQTNIVSEDSRIFWNHFLFYDGDWRTVPLLYPVSMDANMAPTFTQTVKNIYKQQRRWGWGVENVPYVLFGFIKNRKVPIGKKIRFTISMLEGFWSWSTNALLMFALGWLPLYLGGRTFVRQVIAWSLPRVTRTIMTVSMFGIVTSAIIAQSLLQKTKDDYNTKKRASLVLQWIFMPLTIIFFGAFPALEAQTRLMISGKWRLGFWITPKMRSSSAISNRKIV